MRELISTLCEPACRGFRENKFGKKADPKNHEQVEHTTNCVILLWIMKE